jgi:SAM-dependent methyltransferase
VRKVSHVDSKARELITKAYADILPGRTRILDLMSSYESHLPEGLRAEVTGLGMNAEEMAANPALTRHVVHDINADPALPFDDGSFDAVICALSVDYMTRPHAVFREIARVLTPGAPCIMVVSNRWFPNQATNLWTEMHEFERVGFIVECYLQTDQFEQLRTRSERGWPRPQDARDRYYPAIQHSDPVHVAWGTRR